MSASIWSQRRQLTILQAGLQHSTWHDPAPACICSMGCALQPQSIRKQPFATMPCRAAPAFNASLHDAVRAAGHQCMGCPSSNEMNPLQLESIDRMTCMRPGRYCRGQLHMHQLAGHGGFRACIQSSACQSFSSCNAAMEGSLEPSCSQPMISFSRF